MTAPATTPLFLTALGAARLLGVSRDTFARMTSKAAGARRDPDLMRCRRAVPGLKRYRWHAPSLEAYAAKAKHGGRAS